MTETFKAKGLHHWRVRNAAGHVVAESRKGYTRAGDARRAFDRLLDVVGDLVLCGDLPESTLSGAAQSTRVH